MVLLGLFTALTWACLALLITKLCSRWRQGHLMLRAEDNEALLILRKEIRLRRSFSECEVEWVRSLRCSHREERE